MLNKVLASLVKLGEKYCQKRGKELHICGTGGPEDIYLIRYPLFESKFLTVYIHRFLRSDQDDHHDHPFNFWSYVATGGYEEQLLDPAFAPHEAPVLLNCFHTISQRREVGSLAYRPSTAIHRVIVDQELKYADKDKAPLTVIFLGRRHREWGFWKLFPYSRIANTRGFVPWHEYLGVDANSEKARKHQ